MSIINNSPPKNGDLLAIKRDTSIGPVPKGVYIWGFFLFATVIAIILILLFTVRVNKNITIEQAQYNKQNGRIYLRLNNKENITSLKRAENYSLRIMKSNMIDFDKDSSLFDIQNNTLAIKLRQTSDLNF